MHVTPRFRVHYESGRYEAYTARLLSKMCKRASTFVDVGAHYGFFSLLVASKYPQLRVIALEPVRENFQILERNVVHSGLGNIEAHNLAVSNIAEGHTVETIAVDALLPSCKTGPIVLKIDTGGHELAVLDGMAETVRRFPEVALFVKFDPTTIRLAGHEPGQLFEHLEALGFASFLLSDTDQRHFPITPRIDWSTLLGSERHANLVCVPRQHALNVLFIAHTSSMGGAERSLFELVDELIADYWTLATVLTPSEGQLTDTLRNAGASVVVSPYDWWCHPGKPPADIVARLVSSMLSVWQQVPLLRSIDPDLIWTQSLVVPWGALLALLLQKPHVWSVCEYGDKDYLLHFYFPYREVLRFVDLASDFVFTCSPSLLRELFPQLGSERADFLYCKIPIPDRDLLERGDVFWKPAHATRIATFGSIQGGKGQEDVIRALGLLKARGRQVQLLIAGYADGDYLVQLHSLIDKLGVADSVVFTSFIADPYPTMAIADVVVSCSRSEAFGRTVVEAMLLERAVVYTSAGGYVDYMIDGTTGLAYPPGDFDKLAEHIEALIDDPILGKVLGQGARAHAKKFFSTAGYGEKAHKRILELSRQTPRLRASLSSSALAFLTSLQTEIQLQEIKRKEAELQEIYRSRSWRLTAPLRGAVTLLRRVTGR